MPFNHNLTAKIITASLSPYYVSPLDNQLAVDTSSGAVSIILPAIVRDFVKHEFDVYKTTSDATAVTVTVSDGSLINGAASYSLSIQNQGAHFRNDNTGAYFTTDGGFLGGVSSLASTQMIVGSSAGVPTARTITGDVTVSNAGVTTIGAGKVTNAMEAVPKFVYYQETCPVTSFTDGGGTSGTLVLSHTIPAGAVYVRSTVHSLVGFAGDTSATATLGDGSDVDRYNTGTPNFFTTAAAGVDLGVPSGTLFHSAAIATVTLTVTTNADFTACKSNGTGSVVVTLVYHRPV